MPQLPVYARFVFTPSYVTQPSNDTALEMAKKKNPHLIIIDVNKPELNVYTLTRELKKDDILMNVPILISSARGRIDPLFISNMQIEGYLEKPFTAEKFNMEVNKLVQW